MKFWYRAQDVVRDKKRAQLHCVLSGLMTVILLSPGFLSGLDLVKLVRDKNNLCLKIACMLRFTDDNIFWLNLEF